MTKGRRRKGEPLEETIERLCELGGDVLCDPRMQGLRAYIQHGEVTRYEHCLSVACIALRLADRLGLKAAERSMVRGALLHDFFMYDWHDRSARERFHGFTHAALALRTAQEAFDLDEIERDVIARHMFPLNIRPPRTREAALVSMADKLSAVLETIRSPRAAQLAALCRDVWPEM